MNKALGAAGAMHRTIYVKTHDLDTTFCLCMPHPRSSPCTPCAPPKPPLLLLLLLLLQGIPPMGIEKIQDDELREFVELCIRHDPERRPEARQLLKHSFFDAVRDPLSVRKNLGEYPCPCWCECAQAHELAVCALLCMHLFVWIGQLWWNRILVCGSK